MHFDLSHAQFLLAAHRAGQAPPDRGAEVAFAGRSNAGKSSALNAITGRKALARTSKTPGRTQAINFFGLDADRRLVDLPGYGYARVPAATRQQWQALVHRYLTARRSLRGLILVMDIRHPLTPLDLELLDWCAARPMPVHVLLSKADKLKRGAAQQARLKVQAALAERPQISVQLFSATERLGVEQARALLAEWLGGGGE